MSLETSNSQTQMNPDTDYPLMLKEHVSHHSVAGEIGTGARDSAPIGLQSMRCGHCKKGCAQEEY